MITKKCRKEFIEIFCLNKGGLLKLKINNPITYEGRCLSLFASSSKNIKNNLIYFLTFLAHSKLGPIDKRPD